MHRFETIPNIRQRPADDHAHGVIEIRSFHLIFDSDRGYVEIRWRPTLSVIWVTARRYVFGRDFIRWWGQGMFRSIIGRFSIKISAKTG